VRKVSLVPHGESLGATLSLPEADRFSYDRGYREAKIRVALDGRVAEELVFDEVSTGAQADIKQVTALARDMVGAWGMSDRIGPILVLAGDELTWHPVDGLRAAAGVPPAAGVLRSA
jgi:cell division protease FtsH